MNKNVHQSPQPPFRPPTLQRNIRRTSLWNTIAPFLAAVLILAICFAWVVKEKRQKEAAEAIARNQAVEAQQEANRKALEEEKRLAKEDKVRQKLEAEAAKKAKAEEARQRVNWTRFDGVSVKQSATRNNAHAGLAADGNTTGSVKEGTATFALPVLNRKETRRDPAWWQIDLGQVRPISGVHIYNTLDPELIKRLSNFKVIILDNMGDPLLEKDMHTDETFTQTADNLEFDRPINGRYVRIQLNGLNLNGDAVLNLSEVEVWGPKVQQQQGGIENPFLKK